MAECVDLTLLDSDEDELPSLADRLKLHAGAGTRSAAPAPSPRRRPLSPTARNTAQRQPRSPPACQLHPLVGFGGGAMPGLHGEQQEQLGAAGDEPNLDQGLRAHLAAARARRARRSSAGLPASPPGVGDAGGGVGSQGAGNVQQQIAPEAASEGIRDQQQQQGRSAQVAGGPRPALVQEHWAWAGSQAANGSLVEDWQLRSLPGGRGAAAAGASPPGSQPPGSQQRAKKSGRAAAGGGGAEEDPPKRKRRTREEVEADKAAKKAATAARKQLASHSSKAKALTHLTVLLDQGLFGPAGGAVGPTIRGKRTRATGAGGEDKLQATQDLPEDRRYCYDLCSPQLPPHLAIMWRRKVLAEPGEQPAPGGGSGGSLPASQSQQGPVAEEEVEEPHVMVCFEGAAFLQQVLDDDLEGLLRRAEARCRGYRLHLMVHGLDRAVQKREQADYSSALRAGLAGGAALPPAASVKVRVDGFLARLAVECPGAAEHVMSLTRSIAESRLKSTAAEEWLDAYAKSESQSVTNLLVSHPLPKGGPTECLLRALAVMPSVLPGAAHAVAGRYGSLGALMEALLDPGTAAAEVRQLENMARAGGVRPMRVGPKAAAQLAQLLTSRDPDMLVNGDKGS
eukprot:scaffold7.g3567.t1